MQIAKKTYPFSSIPLQAGDILYSSIGPSTYFVGHLVIIGQDLQVKESLPANPSGHSSEIEGFWARHRRGDRIRLYRPLAGARSASRWAQEKLGEVRSYQLHNYRMDDIAGNYCSKFLVQAFYYGADLQLVQRPNRLILPQELIRSPLLQEVALFQL